MSDSNYATNIEDRKSVIGYISTIGGMLTGWMSKTQQVVTLSITEDEYVALSLCPQEGLFQRNFLREIGVLNDKIVIYVDNVGAVFLSANDQVSVRTKHIDVRYHFVKDLRRNDELSVKHICGENNTSEILTKNLDV